MEKTTLKDPKVVSALKGLVRLDTKVEEKNGVSEYFNITATPAYIVLDGKGRVLSRMLGFQTVDKMLAGLPSGKPKLPLKPE